MLKSREQYGANVLTPREKDPLWKQFLEKFEDPLIIILLIAGFLSIAISCWEYWGLHNEDGAAVFLRTSRYIPRYLLGYDDCFLL